MFMSSIPCRSPPAQRKQFIHRMPAHSQVMSPRPPRSSPRCMRAAFSVVDQKIPFIAIGAAGNCPGRELSEAIADDISMCNCKASVRPADSRLPKIFAATKLVQLRGGCRIKCPQPVEPARTLFQHTGD